MMGQANVFLRYAPDKIPYAIERYQREVRRLFAVLDRQLSAHEFIAGEEYSIADIAHWAWVHVHKWSGVEIDGLPGVARWIDTIALRPAVKRGRAVPSARDTADKEPTTAESGRRMLV